jgi:hypothetical protein
MGRSRKDPYSPTEGISAVWRGRGEKIVSDNISSVGVVWMFSGMTQYFALIKSI